MDKTDAFLLEGTTAVLSLEELEETLSYIYRAWVRMDCPGALELPTVQAGTFRGYVNERGAAIGQFKTVNGAVYEVLEDSAELIA